MATSKATQSCLDRLQEALNTVLLEVGTVFADRKNLDSVNLTYHGLRLEKTLPQALHDWHDALDDMECEIVRAKAILRRDLFMSQVKSEPTSTLVATEQGANAQPTDASDSSNKLPAEPTSQQVPKDTSDATIDKASQPIEEPDPQPVQDPKAHSTKDQASEPSFPVAAPVISTPKPRPAEPSTQAQPTTAESTQTTDPTQQDTAPISSAQEAETNDIDALLPGLEQYANDISNFDSINPDGTSGENVDAAAVDVMFNSADITMDGNEAAGNGEFGAFGQSDAHDNSFDELFDLAGLGDGDESGKGEGENSGFDVSHFDAAFFDLEGL